MLVVLTVTVRFVLIVVHRSRVVTATIAGQRILRRRSEVEGEFSSEGLKRPTRKNHREYKRRGGRINYLYLY